VFYNENDRDGASQVIAASFAAGLKIEKERLARSWLPLKKTTSRFL
jgi:hypothetical protein